MCSQLVKAESRRKSPPPKENFLAKRLIRREFNEREKDLETGILKLRKILWVSRFGAGRVFVYITTFFSGAEISADQLSNGNPKRRN